MQLSVVLLSYNTRELTEQALRSVLAAVEDVEAEVFVVDNASVDGSADMVEEKFPQVHLLRNECNTGFAAGNNVALREVQGRYVLLLNTDTIVRRDTFKYLISFMEEHPQVGAVGCKILNPDGTLQLDSRRGFPTPIAAFCKMSGLSRLLPDHPTIARYNMTFLDPEKRAEVDVISGSCMLVRKEAMDEVGLLDEDYFMYGEDIDWCYRIHRAGWKIFYIPDTEIVHFRGESGRGVPLRVLYRKSKAMSIFVDKHMKDRYRFFPPWLLHVGIALYGILRFSLKTARVLALPLVDALLILFGLGLGLTVRYHEALVPLMYQVERLSNQFDLQVEPTRWLAPPPYSSEQWFAVYAVSTLVWLLSFYALGLYGRRRFSPLWAVAGVSLGFALILTLVFFFKAYNFSRLAAGAAWVCNALLLAGWRQGVRWLESKRGSKHGRARALLVGSDYHAQRFVDYWSEHAYTDCDLVGIVCEEGETEAKVVAGRAVVGTTDDLANLMREYKIDTLVFVPGTLAFALEHMQNRWGLSELRVCMVPVDFAQRTAQTEERDKGGRLPLVEILPYS
jgi:GT2 family glycosyltransferase